MVRRAPGHQVLPGQVGELVLWEQNFGPGVFTIFETKNRMLEE
jgi:hypothetical protein